MDGAEFAGKRKWSGDQSGDLEQRAYGNYSHCKKGRSDHLVDFLTTAIPKVASRPTQCVYSTARECCSREIGLQQLQRLPGFTRSARRPPHCIASWISSIELELYLSLTGASSGCLIWLLTTSNRPDDGFGRTHVSQSGGGRGYSPASAIRADVRASLIVVMLTSDAHCSNSSDIIRICRGRPFPIWTS